MAICISTMIGTGVFTSLGFQLAEVSNTWSIIILWLLGGLIALIGAFTYAELGTHFQDSGGDYIFLSRIFHPMLGYLYTWVSLTAGFSAPIAISAMAMTAYVSTPLNIDPTSPWYGIGLIILLSAVHSFTIKTSGRFQDISSALKVLFVVALIAIGFYFAPAGESSFILDQSWKDELLLPGFAVSLIYVSYAYQGWNSAAYIVGEIREPRRNLPIALIGATVLVTVVYVLMQVAMLKHAPIEDLSGQVEVTTIAYTNILGQNGGYWISIFIALQLVATISGYLWIGSRIIQAMAAEHRQWKFVAPKTSNNIPVRAVWLLAFVSILFTVTSTFEQVLIYAGFLLQLMSALTILSVFFIKHKKGTFRSPGGRSLQVFYIVFSVVVLGYTLYERPHESLIGLGLLVLGILTYFFQGSDAGGEVIP